MVRAGEIAGNLDDVLTRLADFLEGSQKLKSKVQSAMIYPLVMVLVGGVIMAVLMVKVIPNITSDVQAAGQDAAAQHPHADRVSDFSPATTGG